MQFDMNKTIYFKNGLNTHFLKIIGEYITMSNMKFIKFEISTNQQIDNSFKIYHPFEYVETTNIKYLHDGVFTIEGVIPDNIVTKSLIELIMTEDDELYKLSGFREVRSYRAMLIKQIFELKENVKF